MAVGRSADYAAQIPTLWSMRLLAQAENLTFWHNMEGVPGSGMPIIRLDELGKQAGDTIKFDMVLALTGTGLTGDGPGSNLEGNEEQLKLRQTSAALSQFQHAVRWTDLADALITHNMRTTALNQLSNWLAEQYDARIFAEFTGNLNPQTGVAGTTVPDANKWAAGTASSRATVADTNAGGRMTLATITELKAYARSALKMAPLKMEDGQEYFGLVMHPYTAMQLKEFDTSWAQAQRDARERSALNPVFTGALGIWDGVILYENNNVPRSTNGSVQTSDNVFFGAQGLSRGYGFYPKWTEEEFSYGQEIGIAARVLMTEKLNVFDLTSAGGAAASALTAVGAMVVYASAVAPGQP